MRKVFRLKGQIQHYAWGGQEFIPKLLGIVAGDKPYAEYWLGAHENAPSLVETDEGDIPLNTFLNTNSKELLGSKVDQSFGRLPYLFKVLDVEQMLSIQVHPSKSEAEKGFKKENELGIALTASHRNYKDDNHKPEIMVALGEFWLLHGFLPEEDLMGVLRKNKEFSNLIAVFLEGGYKSLYQYVMELPIEESDAILLPLINRILPLYKENKLAKSSPEYWAAKAVVEENKKTHFDKGIFSIYFFNILKVNKGDAVFQDAGVPHAYLEGQNMELMANSDNVLRGGLTPKHVDVAELLKHVIFNETRPRILKGQLDNKGSERIYKSPAPDFELSEITLTNSDTYMNTSRSVEIFILMEGEAQLIDQMKTLGLKKGDCFIAVDGAEIEISTTKNALFYKAGTP